MTFLLSKNLKLAYWDEPFGVFDALTDKRADHLKIWRFISICIVHIDLTTV